MSPVRSVPIAPMLLAALLAAAPAAAQVVFTGPLSGANEVPPNASTGSGTATTTYTPATHALVVSVTFTGLGATTTAAHIHCCTTAAMPNVGVASPTPSFPGFPTGVTAGTYANTFDLTQASSYSSAFLTANGGSVTTAEAVLLDAMGKGRAYFNLHSVAFPGGELRANLFEVPIFVSGFQVP